MNASVEFHAVHCSCVVDVKEICTKKRDARAELLFSFKNQLFFQVVVVIVVIT